MKPLSARVGFTRTAGYTLIEILVVLSIVSILAAILMPVFERVREGGYRTTCQSNLRQLSLATQQYVADNDSTYPNAQTWQRSLEPYIKNSQIWECPSELEFPGIGTPGNTDYMFNSGFFNRIILPTGRGFAVELGSRDSRHSHVDPTKLMTYFDSPHSGPYLEVSACGIYTYKGRIDMSARHSEGANYGFLDGHAKWLTPQAAAELYCAMYREIHVDGHPR